MKKDNTLRIMAMVFVSAIALSCLTAKEARSAEIELNYGMAAKIAWDDNIFLDASDRESDVIYHLTPSFEGVLETAAVHMKANYSLDYTFYKNHTEYNRTVPSEIQRLYSELKAGEGEGASLELTEEIKSVTLDETLKSSVSNDIVNRANRSLFTAHPKYLLETPGGSSAEIGYTYKNTSYVNDSGDDSEEHAGDLLLKKKLSEESELFLIGEGGKRNSSKGEDSRKFELRTGASKNADNISVSASGGVQKLFFDQSEDRSFGIWDIEIKYPVLAESSVGARFMQEATFAETGECFRKKTYEANSKFSGRRVRINLSAGGYQNYYLLEDRKDEEKNLSVSTDWSLLEFLEATATARYARLKLLPSEEIKNRYYAGFSLRLMGRRSALNVSYAFRKDDSTSNSNDFTSNSAFLEISGKY